jgi:hypothetical protein
MQSRPHALTGDRVRPPWRGTWRVRDTLYVWIRAVSGDETGGFEVPMSELGKPPEDADYEAELVLEGDRCP